MGTARGLGGNTRALKRHRGPWKLVQGIETLTNTPIFIKQAWKIVGIKDGLIPSNVRNAMNNLPSGYLTPFFTVPNSMTTTLQLTWT